VHLCKFIKENFKPFTFNLNLSGSMCGFSTVLILIYIFILRIQIFRTKDQYIKERGNGPKIFLYTNFLEAKSSTAYLH